MIEIVWPAQMQIPIATIEQWFTTAVSDNWIPPDRLTVSAPHDMARELEKIGWIVLQVNTSCDTTKE
jgi:hypothetical protein